ncbi:MAG: alpha-ketoacid dehydrogenase subunit beta [Elusimicrobia bacterium]|nr:alpha-ketoacid dehydrogenase subunit beta [Elusimicrobiota bacterium]
MPSAILKSQTPAKLSLNGHMPESAISMMRYRDALSLAVRREMERDPKVFVFGLDVPDHKKIFGSTKGLLEQFGGQRCFGTPLSEDAMTGVALGAALAGLRPVHVHIRVDFMLLAMNQIANMISNLAYMSAGSLKIPLVLRAVIGRGWGQSAQHSKSLHSIFAHIPGLKVVMPTSPQDAYSLTRAAIRDDNPVIILEHRWLYDIEGEVNEAKVVPLGEALVRRQGRDATVVATSWMNIEAMKAAEVLAKRGVELEVVDARSIAPLDENTILQSVEKTQRCLVADYDWTYCGFSAELSALIHQCCFGSLKLPVERLGFAPVPCPTTRPLENLFYPSAVSIIRSVERMLSLSETDLAGEQFYSYEQKFKGPF